MIANVWMLVCTPGPIVKGESASRLAIFSSVLVETTMSRACVWQCDPFLTLATLLVREFSGR